MAKIDEITGYKYKAVPGRRDAQKAEWTNMYYQARYDELQKLSNKIIFGGYYTHANTEKMQPGFRLEIYT